VADIPYSRYFSRGYIYPSKFHHMSKFYPHVSLILRSFVQWLCSGWLPMALLSYVAILPWDLLDHSMLSQQTSAAIIEIKTIAHQKGACLKLYDGMRANVHVCIYILPHAWRDWGHVCSTHYFHDSIDQICTLDEIKSGEILCPIQHTCLWWRFSLTKYTHYTIL